MKAASLILLGMGFVTLKLSVGYAVPSSTDAPQTTARSSAHKTRSAGVPLTRLRPSQRNDIRRQGQTGPQTSRWDARQPGLAGRAPKRLSARWQHSVPRSALSLQPHPMQSDVAERGGLVQNRAANIFSSSVRTPSALRTTALPLDNFRHRGPNPALMGGSSNVRSAYTGVIDGTVMKRKP